MNVPFGSPSVYDEFGDVLEQYKARADPGRPRALQRRRAEQRLRRHRQAHPDRVELVHDRQRAARVPLRPHGQQDLRQPVPDVRREKDLTIVSPAPGSSVPPRRFPGIQINAYDTSDASSRRASVTGSTSTGGRCSRSGEFTWYGAPAATASRRLGEHTINVEVVDEAAQTWTQVVDFTLTNEKAIKPVAGGDWAQHHGDAVPLRCRADASAAGQRLAWCYRTEGTFLTGSPVIDDGVVYAGTRDENGDGNSAVHAVRLKTGKKLWSYDGAASIHGSLAVVDGLVFAPTLRLGALRRRREDRQAAVEGRARGRRRTPTTSAPTATTASTVADGKVLCARTRPASATAASGLLMALDAKTGERIWASPMAGATMSDGTPAVTDGTRVRRQRDRRPRDRLRPDHRRPKWTGTETLGGWQDGVPTAADGKVFIGSNNGIVARDGKPPARRCGATRSSRPSLVIERRDPDAAAVKDGIVYMGFPSGAVAALDAEHRQRHLGAGAARSTLPRWRHVQPGVAGNTLFVGANSGRFYALDADTGQPVEHEIGTWVGAGPAVSGNTVVAGAWDGNLYAYVPGGESAPRWATVTGTVSDPETGAEIAGAKVTAVAAGQDTVVTSTDAQGHYRIGLPASTWTVTAAKRGLIADDRSAVGVTVGTTGNATADLKLIKVIHPVAGKSTYAPDYGNGSTRTDVVTGKEYYYLANDKIRASVTPYTAGNNGAGGLGQGALSDLMLNDANGAETLDWGEMLLRPSLTPPDSWDRPNDQLDLPDLAVDGAAVIGNGQYPGEPGHQGAGPLRDPARRSDREDDGQTDQHRHDGLPGLLQLHDRPRQLARQRPDSRVQRRQPGSEDLGLDREIRLRRC